jgi:DNA polymerase (family X)
LPVNCNSFYKVNQKNMPIHNIDVARFFEQTADLLDIKGDNFYRVRAYRNAARNIRTLQYNIRDLASDKERLKELPGIGEDLALKIQTIVNTGELPLLKELKEEIPPGLLELLNIEGLGPKRVKRLNQELGIKNIAELKKAALEGRVQALEGFGEIIQSNLLERIEENRFDERRTMRIEAEQVIEPFLSYLRDSSSIEKVVVAGSYRRKKETIGDIDIIAVSPASEEAGQVFVEYEDVARVLGKGEKKVSVILVSGLQVDLRIVDSQSLGAALQYFTGSKDHNVKLRQLAINQGYKLNEYGLFKNDKNVVDEHEESLYQQLGLSWIPPELREARGELEAASQDSLPNLITLDQVKGDLQMHTHSSDGAHSLEEMAQAAIELGYQYIAITDHSQSLRVANGLDKKRFRQQFEKIDQFNQSQDKIRVLKAAEVDILKDGQLDLDDDLLSEFDLVICSIHTHFSLPIEEQTQRVLTAMESPYFHIFGHPTGRLINSRVQYQIDMNQVIQAAAENQIILEINAQPSRLDLNDENIQKAKHAGVKMSLGTDAHNTDELSYMQFGVDQARRGWAEPNDIINTYEWVEVERLLKNK